MKNRRYPWWVWVFVVLGALSILNGPVAIALSYLGWWPDWWPGF